MPASIPGQNSEQAKRRKSGKADAANLVAVGVGASAGGVDALRTFFAAMPDNPGMAFVVILHLSQEHESHLSQIIQGQTKLNVIQVSKTVKVEPNHVYVIPPAKGLAMVDGVIKLTRPERIRGMRVPIDLFFRTLADAYGPNGIAVILSGTGSDGTLGMKRVKENGGIGIAQDPGEAEYDGMPRSAINAGLVDLVLPVAEMPARIVGFRKNGDRLRLPKEKDEIPGRGKGKEPHALKDILENVWVRTGHDFAAYKHATVLRRIARRMQVHGLAELPEYLEFTLAHHEEAEALQRDLLITVTNFFRDKEAFAVLENEIIPKLFAGKTHADTVRVWSVGCATGEEAYTLAMMLDEFASRITDAPAIQIFASDINEKAIAHGRDCVYDQAIAVDVSPERLLRYFSKQNDGYRVRRELRDLVVFAPHNVLRDPPFSRLDLIVCRNLLIYFNREAQEKVFGIFNFALRGNGYLFLGASESAEISASLFSVVNKKERIYRARPVPQHQTLAALPAPVGWNVKIPHLTAVADGTHHSSAEIHYKLVEQLGPPSVLVNEQHDIIHVSESAGKFLRMAGGEPTRNLLKLIDPTLKLDLQSALFEAKKDDSVGESRNVRFVDGHEMLLNIIVRRVETTDAFYLVIFENARPAESAAKIEQEPSKEQLSPAGRAAMDGMIKGLEADLLNSNSRLQTTIEQNDTSSEELRAQNEEMQAMNEELRSALEELETSKEELQSLNEELITVNHELKDKVEEVTRSNSDLRNLMVSTNIGTIFLDRALRVKLYTPPAAEIFNLIPSDVGRPFEHLTHKLDYDGFTEDAGEVLRSLLPQAREVRSDPDDSSYLAQVTPYRTLDDKIDGVVLTFVDVTDLRRSTELLRVSEEKYRTLFNSIDEGYCIIEMIFDENEKAVDYKFLDVSPSFEKQTGIANARGRRMLELVPQIEKHWFETYGKIAVTGESRRFENRAEQMHRWYDVFAFRYGKPEDRQVAVLFNDISQRKQAENELLRHREELESTVNQRTAELTKTNQELEAENKQRRLLEAERLKLMAAITTVQEDERRRLALDLHDHFGQQLTALRLRIEFLGNGTQADEEFKKVIDATKLLVRQIDEDVDSLSWDLRPPSLDEIGLASTLADYIREWSRRFEIPAKFHSKRFGKRRLAGDTETHLYRITQEILTNIVKHASATAIDISLDRNGDFVVLTARDNGVGFTPKKLRSAASASIGIGLIGMRERAAIIGGDLNIESAPGKGTMISVHVPLPNSGKAKK